MSSTDYDIKKVLKHLSKIEKIASQAQKTQSGGARPGSRKRKKKGTGKSKSQHRRQRRRRRK